MVIIHTDSTIFNNDMFNHGLNLILNIIHIKFLSFLQFK